MVPFRYTLRSLGRRKWRTAMTVGGVALVIALYATMSSVGQTMIEAFRATGAPDEVVVVQAGAMTVDFSKVGRDTLPYLETLDGIAHAGGHALVSPELCLSSKVHARGVERDAALRGVGDIAPRVYRQVALARGEWPSPGRHVAIGRTLATKLGVGIGDPLDFEGERWTVVGLLEAGGRVYDQEIWVDLDDLAGATHRTTLSGYTVRAISPDAAARLIDTIDDDRRFPITAMSAHAFYARASGMARFMAVLGSFIALVVAFGAAFGGMNTMYSAVARRRHEVGVLRALGYRPRAVLFAFLVESLLLCLAGGAIGLGIAAALSLLSLDLPYTAASHFSLGASQVGWSLVIAAAVGIAGGCLPALRAARMKVVDALR